LALLVTVSGEVVNRTLMPSPQINAERVGESTRRSGSQAGHSPVDAGFPAVDNIRRASVANFLSFPVVFRSPNPIT